MLEMIKNITLLLCLFVNAWTDAKRQQVCPVFLALTGTIGVLCGWIGGGMHAADFIADMLPGAGLILYGRLTKESVGYGDGMAFLTTGMFLGLWENLFLLLVASVLAAVYAAFCLLTGKVKRGDKIPFLPFVFAAYTAGLPVW